MNEQVKDYLGKYPDRIVAMFHEIRHLLMEMQPVPEEKLWARLPSYYVGEAFVRLIPFKNHLNIEAKAIPEFTAELDGYKLTPKGMLQIYLKDEIPTEVLKRVFASTFEGHAGGIMSDSKTEKNILSSEYPYLQPFFYNHPYALRCELGIGDGEPYMQTAKQRALEIYRLLFPHGADALFFDYWVFDDCYAGEPESESDLADILDEVYENRIESTVENLKFLLGFQRRYRRRVVRHLKGYGDEDETFLGRSRVICYSDGKGFEAEEVICRQIDNQSRPLVSFVSFAGEFIFSVYDDRGCDIVFATPEAYAAHYDLLQPYFLDYDRELMQSRLSICEKSQHTGGENHAFSIQEKEN